MPESRGSGLRAYGRAARDGVNRRLRSRGYELRRLPANLPVDQYIDLDATLSAARAAGLSVGDYIDTSQNQAGATEETMQRLADLGALPADAERVCEIGPGSGRYLAKTIERCAPGRYEIYESSDAWRDWLVRTYDVVALDGGGRSLRGTPDGSVDLVQAHKVFSTIAPVMSLRYLIEMARVVRPGGHVVFDAVTEDCLDEAAIARWVSASNDYQTYPAFLPKQVVSDLFARRGCSLVGEFTVSMAPGRTQCLVLRRNASDV